LPFGLVAIAFVAFRLPLLLNPGAINSDGAIYGLQARHVLDGEWSRFLWGAPYQGTIDVMMIAAIYAIAGSSMFATMLAPVLGQAITTWLGYTVVRKRVGAWQAAFAVAPLVIASFAINYVIVYVARQWSITLLVLSIWLIDGAAQSRRPSLRIAGGLALAGAMLYADMFSMVFLPAIYAFAIATLVPEGQRWPTRAGLVVWATGIAAGIALAMVLRTGSAAPQAHPALDRIGFNFQLLRNTCLPWLLGLHAKVSSDTLLDFHRWHAPVALAIVQWIGAITFAAALASGGVALFARRVPRAVRLLGGLGAATTATTLAAFLVSATTIDLMSARYLAPMIWTAPFALAPLAWWLGPRKLAAALGPYLIASAVAGWLAYGAFVEGPLPIARATDDESQLRAALQARDVHYAAADYWLAYHLTLRWNEQIIVVPVVPEHNRYAPYWEGFQHAPTVAYIFHASVHTSLEQLQAAAGPGSERIDVAGFTVLVHHRAPDVRQMP
jgi:hypothetical protein